MVQISQAPTQNAGKTGRPFSKNPHEPDESGKKLIEWYSISKEVFFDPNAFYITGIGHCYPGKRATGGDANLPWRCAQKWLKEELSYLNPKIFIIVGRHSAEFFFPRKDFSQLVFQDQELYDRPALVLPHP
jgi:uracil-DNA glycosylase family 4